MNKLLTTTAKGFEQLMAQYMLFVGFVQMPAILINSHSRIWPGSMSTLLFKKRARFLTNNVSCSFFSLVVSINFCN
jgi:hypothetical protein